MTETPDPTPPALPQGVFMAIAAVSTVLTVAWWRSLLPISAWLNAEPTPLVLAGQYLLATVLHAGALHLVFNLYWVRHWAPAMERRWGPAALLAGFAWLAMGIGGAELLLNEAGVGLSGVVYGVVGFLWFAERDLPEPYKLVRWTDVRFFGGWFFICFPLTWLNLLPVANGAHGSGAVLGSVLGLATRWPRPAQIALGVGVPVLSLAALYV